MKVIARKRSSVFKIDIFPLKVRGNISFFRVTGTGLRIITAGLTNVYTKQETDAKIQEAMTEVGGYEHNQIVASDSWNILHNLGYKPNIQIEDSAGDSVLPFKITHNSVNNTLVLFSGAMS